MPQDSQESVHALKTLGQLVASSEFQRYASEPLSLVVLVQVLSRFFVDGETHSEMVLSQVCAVLRNLFASCGSKLRFAHPDLRGPLFCLLFNAVNICKKEAKFKKETKEGFLSLLLEVLLCIQKGSSPEQTRVIVSNFLPGVLSCVSGILVSDSKLGSNLFVSSIKIFELCITSTLSNALPIPAETQVASNAKSLGTQCDFKWYQQTFQKVCAFVVQIFSLNRSSSSLLAGGARMLRLEHDLLNWRFRAEKARAAGSLLHRCSTALKPVLKTLCDSLMFYAFREDDVKDLSSVALGELDSVVLVHRDKFFEWMLQGIENLPHCLRSEHEDDSFACIIAVLGYTTYLNNDVSVMLGFCRPSSTEFSSLLNCLEVDYQDSMAIERETGYYEIRFRLLPSRKSRKAMVKLLQTFGSMNGARDLIRHCLFSRVSVERLPFEL